MFNNIIYVIIVLVLFQFNYPTEGLFRSPVIPIFIILLVWLNFALYCRYHFSRLVDFYRDNSSSFAQSRVSSSYQLAITKLSILSIFIFVLCVYVLNLKYWLLTIPGFATFSILPSAVAMSIFFVFLSTIWYYAYPAYCVIFPCSVTRLVYVVSNIKLNLPILFPWAILTICYDIIGFFASPSLKKIFENEIGQFIFFTVFLILIVLFLPPLIKYWWGCSSLPQTEKKEAITNFLRMSGFKYKDILRWPILEGRMMTAGVMGLVPRFRYILITDSLLNILSEEELNAVMAHEIGHIKYKHILFYILFLLGYMALSIGLLDVLFYAMAAHPWLFDLLQSQKEVQIGIFYSFFSVPVILSIILYFRYIMGFFMRNFERQADLYSAKLMGTPKPTIMSLEKIAHASGQRRDDPSWHHFSIAERIDFLWRSLQNPQLIKRHSRRLALFLIAFFMLISSLGYALNFSPLKKTIEHISLTHILNRQLIDSPECIETYKGLAHIYHKRGDLSKARWAYENILRLDPNDEMALNNLAWILATAQDTELLDYPRALLLAKLATDKERSPTFLDTLAEAYYVNGLQEKAIQTIKEALDKASENRKYLVSQLEKFRKGEDNQRR
jgi:Zn-dependent protease with chaperone function